MKTISKHLMLGLDHFLCMMFSKTKHIKNEILDMFNVAKGDSLKKMPLKEHGRKAYKGK